MVAAACKYKTKEFPAGRRGMWFSRQGYGVKDYFMQANATTLSVILIEDIEAVRNLDAILAVEGIDVLSVAFADLAQSMGCVPSAPLLQRTRCGPTAHGNDLCNGLPRVVFVFVERASLILTLTSIFAGRMFWAGD